MSSKALAKGAPIACNRSDGNVVVNHTRQCGFEVRIPAQVAASSILTTEKGSSMRRSIILACAASLAISLSGSAFSQGAPQTVTLMKVDPQTLATGYRTSKVVGATVVNDANETVGTIDDLIVTPGGQTPYAVLSVGGALGMGTRYVVVPFTSLKIVDKKMVLPGGSKDALKALPEFKYAS
jgi:hypothetical protein